MCVGELDHINILTAPSLRSLGQRAPSYWMAASGNLLSPVKSATGREYLGSDSLPHAWTCLPEF